MGTILVNTYILYNYTYSHTRTCECISTAVYEIHTHIYIYICVCVCVYMIGVGDSVGMRERSGFIRHGSIPSQRKFMNFSVFYQYINIVL